VVGVFVYLIGVGAEKEQFMFWPKKGLFGFCFAFILLSLLLPFDVSLAQTGSTSLRGTVTDPNGASVPDATVTLTSDAIGLSLTAKTGFSKFVLQPTA
jgi:hypothetical protein